MVKDPTKPKTARKVRPRVLLVMDMYMAYGRGLLSGITKYCKLHKSWETHLQKASHISEIFKLAESWEADAIITDIPYEKKQEKLFSLDVPFITTMAPPKKNKKMYYIEWDNFNIGSVAAKYYLENHLESYAFCGYKDFLWSKNRGKGFCETVQSKGFDVSVYERTRTYALRRGKQELATLAKWLTGLAQPAAVFACNDTRARHVIEACGLANLEIPQQIAVMGASNDEIECDLFTPPLSSVALNMERAGYEAAELLQKLISGQKIDSNVIVIKPKHVVERESTNILQIEDQDVARALRYIRQNSNQILRLSDVTENVSVSKRTLERKFTQALGHTIHEEIRNCHSQYIALLLIETNTPVLEIARSIGYTSEQNISRLFRKTMECSPREYRKKYGKTEKSISMSPYIVCLSSVRRTPCDTHSSP